MTNRPGDRPDEHGSHRPQSADPPAGGQPGLGRPGHDQPTFQQPGRQPGAGQLPQQPGGPGQPAAGPYGAPGPDRQPPPPGYWQPPAPASGPPPWAGRQGGHPGGSVPGHRPSGRTPDRGRSRLPLILIGALVGVVVITVIIVAVVRGANGGRTTASQGPARSVPASTAADAVRGYLEALAAGDADRALQYLARPPADTTLLTDAVLKTSAERAPISAISVGRPTEGPYGDQVTATYRVGEQTASADFAVIDRAGSHRISQGTEDVALGSHDGLAITVNGVPVDQDRVTVFPGSYQVETTTKYIELGSGAAFTVLTPADYTEVSLQPKLDSAGQKLFRQKVMAAARTCVASTRLKVGCGLQLEKKLSDGTVLVDGSVHRTMPAATKSELRHLTAELDSSAPTVATASLTGSIDVRVDGRRDGRTIHQGELFGFGRGTQLGRPSMDMAADEPVVEWE